MKRRHLMFLRHPVDIYMNKSIIDVGLYVCYIQTQKYLYRYVSDGYESIYLSSTHSLYQQHILCGSIYLLYKGIYKNICICLYMIEVSLCLHVYH